MLSRRGADASALHAVRRMLMQPATSQVLLAGLGLNRGQVFFQQHQQQHALNGNELHSSPLGSVGAFGTSALDIPWVKALLVEEQAAESATNSLQPDNAVVAELAAGTMGRSGHSLPLVDSWDCLRELVGVWQQACGRMDDYSMHHTRMLVNLCNLGIEAHALRMAMTDAPCKRLAHSAS